MCCCTIDLFLLLLEISGTDVASAAVRVIQSVRRAGMPARSPKFLLKMTPFLIKNPLSILYLIRVVITLRYAYLRLFKKTMKMIGISKDPKIPGKPQYGIGNTAVCFKGLTQE
jgi:hypothetical protein